MKLKFIGTLFAGVAIGYYLGQHYDFEMKLDAKEKTDA